jgi:tensin
MSSSYGFYRKGNQSPLPMNGHKDPESPAGSIYYGQSQRSSLLSLNDSEVITQHPIFIRDTSSYWYKPNISREDGMKLFAFVLQNN